MKALQLLPHSILLHRENNIEKNNGSNVQEFLTSNPENVPLQKNSKPKPLIYWFNPDAPENHTVTEVIIRAAFVITMPVLPANYTHPSKYE